MNDWSLQSYSRPVEALTAQQVGNTRQPSQAGGIARAHAGEMPVADLEMRIVKQAMRRLPQRSQQGVRTSGLTFQSFDAAVMNRSHRRRRADDPRPALGHDAAVGAKRPMPRRSRRRHCVRDAHRSRRGTQSNPGGAVAAAQSRRDQRAVKDLLAVDVDVNAYLPPTR